MEKDLILTDKDNLEKIILKLYLYITQNQKDFLQKDLFYKNIKILSLFNNIDQADCKTIEDLLKLLYKRNIDTISKCQSMINLLTFRLYEKDLFSTYTDDDICEYVCSKEFGIDMTDKKLSKRFELWMK